MFLIKYEPRCEKTVTAQLISAFVSTIPLLPKSEISSIYLYSMVVQPDLCLTMSETPGTGFLTTRLICTCIDVATGVTARFVNRIIAIY